MKADGRMYQCDLCGRLLFAMAGKSINHERFIEKNHPIEMIICPDIFDSTKLMMNTYIETECGWTTCNFLNLPGDGLICKCCKEKIVTYISSKFGGGLDINGIDDRRTESLCEESISGGLVES